MVQFLPHVRTDNIIAALGHNDRVCKIDLNHVRHSQWEQVLAANAETIRGANGLVNRIELVQRLTYGLNGPVGNEILRICS